MYLVDFQDGGCQLISTQLLLSKLLCGCSFFSEGFLGICYDVSMQLPGCCYVDSRVYRD